MTPDRSRSGIAVPSSRPAKLRKRLRMRAERNLVQIPVALVGLIMKRIREVVDVRQLHELAQRVADDAAVFDLSDVAVVGEMDFPARKEARVVHGAGQGAVDDRERARAAATLFETPGSRQLNSRSVRLPDSETYRDVRAGTRREPSSAPAPR